jgi:diamine N-acetyltransferase
MSLSTPTLETLQFRQATESDIETLRVFARDVFVETFSSRNSAENMAQYLNEAFTLKKIREEVLDSSNVFVLAEYQQTVIAYYKITTAFDKADPSLPAELLEKPSILLERFYVDFAWHGTHVAKQMMQHCMDLVTSLNKEYIWLGVWEENIRAQKFYQKWNFEIVGSHPFLVGDEVQTDYWMGRSI